MKTATAFACLGLACLANAQTVAAVRPVEPALSAPETEAGECIGRYKAFRATGEKNLKVWITIDRE